MSTTQVRRACHNLSATSAGPLQVLEALIPNSDVPRFLDGEAARCEGDRFTKRGERVGKSCSFLCPCAGKPYESIYGPRNVLARGRALTASKKVGCEARFTVTYDARPGVALVRYICYEHAAECRVQTPRRVPLAARLRIVSFLAHDPGLQPHTLVEKNVAAARARSGTGGTHRARLRQARPPRTRVRAPYARREARCTWRGPWARCQAGAQGAAAFALPPTTAWTSSGASRLARRLPWCWERAREPAPRGRHGSASERLVVFGAELVKPRAVL